MPISYGHTQVHVCYIQAPYSHIMPICYDLLGPGDLFPYSAHLLWPHPGMLQPGTLFPYNAHLLWPGAFFPYSAHLLWPAMAHIVPISDGRTQVCYVRAPYSHIVSINYGLLWPGALFPSIMAEPCFAHLTNTKGYSDCSTCTPTTCTSKSSQTMLNFLALVQPCSIESIHLVHSGSNSKGVLQYLLHLLYKITLVH